MGQVAHRLWRYDLIVIDKHISAALKAHHLAVGTVDERGDLEGEVEKKGP